MGLHLSFKHGIQWSNLPSLSSTPWDVNFLELRRCSASRPLFLLPLGFGNYVWGRMWSRAQTISLSYQISLPCLKLGVDMDRDRIQAGYRLGLLPTIMCRLHAKSCLGGSQRAPISAVGPPPRFLCRSLMRAANPWAQPPAAVPWLPALATPHRGLPPTAALPAAWGLESFVVESVLVHLQYTCLSAERPRSQFSAPLTAILRLNIPICMGNNSCVADVALRLKRYSA